MEAEDYLETPSVETVETRRAQRRRERRLRRRDRRGLETRALGYMWDSLLGVECPVCHSGPGQPCVTRSGIRRSGVHRARRNLSNATRPSCISCGACCLTGVWGGGQPERAADPFIDVFPSEGFAPEEVVSCSRSVSGLALRIEAGRCAFLRGSVPGAQCGIYERRPIVCRAFVPGSYRCRVVRSRAGLEKFPDGRVR